MAVSILTMSVTLTPALLSMTLVWAGLLPALVVLAAAVLGAWLPLGTGAGLLMLLFLLPPFAAFIICVANDVPFFHTAAIIAAAELAGGFAVLLYMNRQADGELARTLAEQFARLIEQSGQQDELLIMFMQSGLARLNPSLYSQAQGLLGGLSALGREELMLSLKASLTDVLSLLPALLISLSIWHSLLGPAIGIYFGRRSVIRQVVDGRRRELLEQVIAQRRAQMEEGAGPGSVRLQSREQIMRELSGDCEKTLRDFPTLQMPPFSLWHLPRRAGLMAGLPALGYLVAVMSANAQAQLVGNMLGAVFSAIYTIQGMAAMDFVLGRGGRGLGFRCVMMALGAMLAPRLYLILGVVDQLINIRKLRPPLMESNA